MPSFSPLSTLSARRIRLGTDGFVTSPAPRPASVGARHAATRTADHSPSSPKKKCAKRAPAPPCTEVRFRASVPEVRHPHGAISSRSRAASEKRISTNVISAVTLMGTTDTVIWKASLPPNARPPIAKTIGAVTPMRSARPRDHGPENDECGDSRSLPESSHITPRALYGKPVIH